MPVPGKKMIPAHVHDDPGKPPALLAESCPALYRHLVGVGVAVDSPALKDPLADPGIEAAGRVALDKVSENAAEPGVIAVAGQE